MKSWSRKGGTHRQIYVKFNNVPFSAMDCFEGIGVLVKKKLIEVSLIDDLISSLVMMFWNKTNSFVREYRARRNIPQFAEYLEYLYNEVKTIAELQHPELKT